jgi:hypothetical protein
LQVETDEPSAVSLETDAERSESADGDGVAQVIDSLVLMEGTGDYFVLEQDVRAELWVGRCEDRSRRWVLDGTVEGAAS